MPASARAPATSSRSSAATGAGGRRPTRWPARPRCRRRRPRWSPSRSYDWGDGDWMAAPGGQPTRTPAPMSVYEVHLGSWRPGLALPRARRPARRLRRRARLHARRAPAGDGAPVRRRRGATRSPRTTRRPRGSATPDDFRYLVDALHQAGIGVILDWVPGALPQGRVGARPVRRPAAVRAPRPAHAASTPTGAPYVFDFGRREVRNFLVANALYWLEEFHIDGLRVDAVASMLYLDYSRKDGEWAPNMYGGRENLEAIALPAGDERDRLQAGPRHRHDRRGVDRVAGRHAADAPGRSRLRPQVEHGLDARLPAVHRARSRSTASTTTAR